MGSLIEELPQREAAARAEADRLRSRIEELSEDLARAEEQVSRLAIAREEVTRVMEEPAAADPPARPRRAGQQARGENEALFADRGGDGAAVAGGFRGVGAARVHQGLLEVAADAGRCGQCSSLPRPGWIRRRRRSRACGRG